LSTKLRCLNVQVELLELRSLPTFLDQVGSEHQEKSPMHQVSGQGCQSPVSHRMVIFTKPLRRILKLSELQIMVNINATNARFPLVIGTNWVWQAQQPSIIYGKHINRTGSSIQTHQYWHIISVKLPTISRDMLPRS